MDQGRYRLPGGLVDSDGNLHRQVKLAQLSGHEEEFLAAYAASGNAALVTYLLGCCLLNIGEIRPVSEDIARSLLIADRQYLLLKLYEITFGPHVQATITCPRLACGERFDLDFMIDDVPIRPLQDKGPCYHMQLSQEAAFDDEGHEYQREIVFRLPNGADQEAIEPVLFGGGSEAQAAILLLARCIQATSPAAEPGVEYVGRLSPQARQEIEKQMEEMAPQVDLMMEGSCPECSLPFAIPLDIAGLLLRRLQTSLDTLYRETHYLAYHYHWSEQEIMAMSRPKRRHYIHILAEEIERLNHALA